MLINLNVKIKGGPRTPVDVDIYGTSVNEKIIKFKNGKKISENEIAEKIQQALISWMRNIQES